MNTAKWKTYEFGIFEKQISWNAVGGIYIFAGSRGGMWHPYYVGQADSFQSRIPSHDRWDDARMVGATHIHAMVVEQSANRDKIEKELIGDFQPPLNVHHR
jgi:excinuclease UvrABC nuclease subunit